MLPPWSCAELIAASSQAGAGSINDPHPPGTTTTGSAGSSWRDRGQD